MFCYLCFIVGTSGLNSGDPSSSAEQTSTSAGGYTSATVGLAVCLGVAVAVLVIIVIVVVARRVHASRLKTVVPATASGGTVRVAGSLRSWGFSTIRSTFSIDSEDSADAESS